MSEQQDRCPTCGQRPANLSAHRDYVHVDNGQRKELRLEDGMTVLAPVCTGHKPVDVWTVGR